MRPGARFGRVQANAQGYRGPEIALEKPPGAIRFAFLGDSLTFGSWSGGNDTTWPHHVLETLRAASGGASYDYINAALPGNGIGELTIQFLESICKFRPDVVALAPAAGGSVATMTPEDADAIAQLPNILAAVPELGGSVTARYGNIDYQTQVTSTAADFPIARNWPVARGTFFSRGDVRACCGAGAISILYRRPNGLPVRISY